MRLGFVPPQNQNIKKDRKIRRLFGLYRTMKSQVNKTKDPPTYLKVDNLYPKRRQKWAIFGPPTHLILST